MANTANSDNYVLVNELSEEHRMYAQLQELREFYCSQFGSQPQFFVKVPGRVNIIGEHVDYCGYPVLPMALDQCILLAVGYSDDNTLLQLRNMEGEKFENYKSDLQNLRIDLPASGGPEWYKYYLCGIKGIYESLSIGDSTKKTQPIGMKVVLHGNIPPSSGLSSSSALVSASVLATAHVHGMTLDRKQLAAISANCERYIGTQGGGMDQAIAYLAKDGCAQFIEFHPELSATPIMLPGNACFVVANSLAEKNKAASSDFNERVVECRLASRMMAKHMKLSQWRELIRFAQLQEALQCSLQELREIAENVLSKEIYDKNEICLEFGTSEKELEEDFLTANTRHMIKFKLRPRALHVIQESLRVEKFRETCESLAMNATTTNTTPLEVLSNLMQQSHQSLRDLYECSHPNLDTLISISQKMGIQGARLTGAGWGGCMVALCDSTETSIKYMDTLKQQYFSKLPADILEKHQHNDFGNVVFSTHPRSGAEIIVAYPKAD